MKLKSSLSKFLTNKLVLNIVSVVALLNVIGYMVMGNVNNVIFFIILAVLVRYFSKNMIIVLGIPLIVVNLLSLKNDSNRVEGMKNSSDTENEDSKNKGILKKALDDNEKSKSSPIVPLQHNDNNTNDESTTEKSGFEVGRKKNGGSKIDYAATIEDAYDELNNILGSDGIKRLTDDTQNLMKQQMQLAEAMKGMGPIIKNMQPMLESMKDMMSNMGDGNASLGNVMEMAKKMTGGKSSSEKS